MAPKLKSPPSGKGLQSQRKNNYSVTCSFLSKKILRGGRKYKGGMILMLSLFYISFNQNITLLGVLFKKICYFVTINTASFLRRKLDKGVLLSDKDPIHKKRNSKNVYTNDSNHLQEIQHAQVVEVPKTTLPSYDLDYAHELVLYNKDTIGRNIDDPEDSEDEGQSEEEDANVNDE